jgi:hypothetical protein
MPDRIPQSPSPYTRASHSYQAGKYERRESAARGLGIAHAYELH